ncbi:MAG: hypothetical protein ABSE82_06775 [Nitrososphaerales archaeon]|jgi:hypothetical protein
MNSQDYALVCDDESGLVLSNWRALEVWSALEKLIQMLLKDSDFSNFKVLYSWKENHHLAVAKEPYAWRAAIEEIKNSDLTAKCAMIENREEATLMSDKPTMLKIAGEITNGLMHSYAARHKLNFSQRVSKVPF